MLASSVTVVVPLGREAFLPSVLCCFRAQRESRRRLVVVENGDAVGACARLGVRPDAVLTSERGASQARNEGIEWVRKHGGGFFSAWDDDDYYGPGYLSEMMAASDRGDVVGKACVYMRTVGGTMRTFVGDGEGCEVGFVVGPSICGWSENADAFPLEVLMGEDVHWTFGMRQRGATIWSTSRRNFMQRRFPQPAHRHLWRINDFQMAQLFSGDVYDVGEEDLGVVDGRRPEPPGALFPKREYRPWHHPDWIGGADVV